MSGELGTDPQLLRTDAYRDSAKLRDRIALYAFQQPLLDPGAIYLDQVSWPPDAVVLDVGCGPGQYLRRLLAREPSLRVIECDLSQGMAAEACAGSTGLAAVGDAAQLPFADDSFDRVLAMHMLYHVADTPAAVAELRRVLRRDGRLLVSTNGRNHHAGIRSALRDVGIPDWSNFSDRFSLEDGEALLRRQFDDVRLLGFQAEIVLTDPVPAIRFVASMDTFGSPQLPAGMTWDDVVDRFGEHVAAIIATEGEFRSPTETGVFVCQ